MLWHGSISMVQNLNCFFFKGGEGFGQVINFDRQTVKKCKEQVTGVKLVNVWNLEGFVFSSTYIPRFMFIWTAEFLTYTCIMCMKSHNFASNFKLNYSGRKFFLPVSNKMLND